MRAILVACVASCLLQSQVRAADRSTDPVALAPKDYRVLFENESVRVLDHKLAPKAKEPRHFSPARVTVNLTAQHTKITLDGGDSLERDTAAGVAAYRGAEFQQVENLGDAEGRSVIVELKEAGAGLSTVAAWSDLPGARDAQKKHPDAARVALSGSRDQAGRFAERVRLADGYIAPPRVHSQELHVTVLAGRDCVGYGTRVVRHEAKCHGPGDYFVIPAGEVEFEWAEGETILQVDGVGPLAVTSAPEGAVGAPPAAAAAPAPAAPEPATPAREQPPARAVEPPPAPPPPSRATDPALKHVTAAGYDFSYFERGEGPALILLHGRFDDYRALVPVVNALSREHRVIVPSRRFHFPNAVATSGGYDFERHADDLVALVAALGLESADVAGEGYGAAVAMLAAQREPQRIRRLVLIEPALVETLSDPKIAKALGEHDRALFAEAAKAYKPDDPAAALRPLIDGLYGGGTYDAATPERRAIWNDNAATVTLAGATSPGIGCDAAGAVAQPVLIVRGTRSPDTQRALGRALERCMRKAQTLDVADAGMDPQLDQPASFVAGVSEFLE